MNPPRITLTLGAAAGGLLAAFFLPVAVAFADEYLYVPDTSTFDVKSSESLDDIYQVGTEDWSAGDFTTGKGTADTLSGMATQTELGNPPPSAWSTTP